MHFTNNRICRKYLNSKSTGKNSQNISQFYLKVLKSEVKSTLLLKFCTYYQISETTIQPTI